MALRVRAGGVASRIMAALTVLTLNTKSTALTVMLLAPPTRPVMSQLQVLMPLPPTVLTGPTAAAVSTVTVGIDPSSTVPPIVWLVCLAGEFTAGLRVSTGGVAFTAQVATVGVVAGCWFPDASLPSTANVCDPSARPLRTI